MSKHVHSIQHISDVEQALQVVGEGIIIANDVFELQFVNTAGERITGFSQSDLFGKNVIDALQITPPTALPLADVLESQEPHTTEQTISVRTAQDNHVPITFHLAPLLVDEKLHIMMTFRTMTHMDEISRMKSEFVSIVSHQLRTPLSAIKWFLETLIENKRQDPMSDRQKDYLQQAYQSNERMILLINDLLSVSRLESGKMAEKDMNPIQVVDTFNSVVEELQAFARANNVEIQVNLDKNTLPAVRTDENHIRQVIQNITSNAIKYTRGKQTVTINGTIEGDKVIFSVTDQGIGINEEDKKRLFDPFFRADNALATQAEGSGLGLYICKLLLEFNNGAIWFESQEGVGSTFYFSLPIED